jgi:tetratricopeptide (TPR) repeat protein
MDRSRGTTLQMDASCSSCRGRQCLLKLLGALLLTVQALSAAEAAPDSAQGFASSRPRVPGNQGVHSQLEIRLRQAVERAPASFEANYRLGEFYVQMRKLKAGIPYLKKAHELNPAHYANGYDLALAYFETGDQQMARRQIQEMLGQRDTPELHNLLGDVEEKSGDPVRAAQEYQLAAQQDPSERNIFDWGNELLLHGAFEEAEKVFSDGIERHPNSSRLHVGLGIAFYSRGFYDDAARVLCHASDLEPSDPRPYLFLGKMFDISLSQAEEVQARLRRFVQSHPRNAQAHYYYAMSLWKGERTPKGVGDKREVEGHLKQATALDPALAEAHLHLGNFYADEDKLQQAIFEYRRTIGLKPDLASAHYRLSQTYRRSGDLLHAQEELECYQRLHAHDTAEDAKK